MELLVPEQDSAHRFGRLKDAFERAAQTAKHGVEQTHYLFGGRAVRTTIVGRQLARNMMRPFTHLRAAGSSDGTVRLDIRLWDEGEVGTHVPEERRANDTTDEERTEISSGGRFLHQSLPGSTIALDRKTRQIVGNVTWSNRLDVYQQGKPFARLLAEWYADEGLGVMHAGLVARGREGVLLAGKGGSGKSTFAVACARAAVDFLGEDYAALQFVDEGSIVGHSAYNSVFLTPTAAAWFPELTPHLIESRNGRETKSVAFLGDVWPSLLVSDARIRAVALCRVVEANSPRVRPASRSEALLAVAPSSLLQIHGRRRDSLDRLARLIDRVPCFRLDIGRDLSFASGCIDDILKRSD